MNIEQAIHTRLLALCRERNITIPDLAQRTSIAPAILAALADGTNQRTTIETIDQLCEALDINPADFFCHDTFRNLEKA